MNEKTKQIVATATQIGEKHEQIRILSEEVDQLERCLVELVEGQVGLSIPAAADHQIEPPSEALAKGKKCPPKGHPIQPKEDELTLVQRAWLIFEQNPQITFRNFEVARALGVPRGSASYAVHELRRAGIIERVAHGQHRYSGPTQSIGNSATH